MEVSFEGLSCVAPLTGKLLLDNVSGQFLPGELTGILGPSGAGKTTLLNAISGYRRSGVKGRISAGKKRSRCYLTQEDLLAPFLTAGEQMYFASRLKLPSSYTSKQRSVIVEELQNTLGLDQCVDTRTELLSGGQRKRLCIALELVNNPPIVFLDEPTSGLDISSASLMVRMLSKLSRSGRTIVITIHQPSATLFDLFDRVYFLAVGKCVYQGGPGAHLVSFLDKYNFVCPRHYNPADYLIEVIEDKKNIDILSRALENGKTCWYSADATKNAINGQELCAGVKYTPLPNGLSLLEDNQGSCATFWLQFWLILERIYLQTKRNKIVLKILLFQYVLCALIICALFYKTANNGTRMHATLNLCMTVVLFLSYSQQMSPVVYYPFEVKLLKKEHFNQWYSLFPYYLAFKISKLPYLVFLILIFTCLVFGMSGIPWEWDRFAIFFMVNVLTSFVALSFGLTIGSLFNVTNGSAIGSMGLTVFVGLASYGFDFMRSISFFMEMVVRTSYMRAAVYTLGLTIFGMDRQRLDCPEEEVHCHFREPKAVLHFLNLDGAPVWRFLGDLVGCMFFYWLTFYLALKWRLRR